MRKYQTQIHKNTMINLNDSADRSRTPQQNDDKNRINRSAKSVVRPSYNNNVQLASKEILFRIQQYSVNNRFYYLGKGNNSQVIKQILNLRKNWIQTSCSSDLLSFKWLQNSYGFKYYNLGKHCLCFNHFENHRQLSNKQRLVWNMTVFCESNKLNSFDFLPLTYIIDLTTGQQDLTLHNFVRFYNRNIPASHQQPKTHSILLPKTKYMPYLSSQQLYKKSQGNFYCKPFIPKTFMNQDSNGSYLWILKPTFMNRGRGVSLFRNLKEFESLVWKYYEGEGLEDYCCKQISTFLEEQKNIRRITDIDEKQQNEKKQTKTIQQSIILESVQEKESLQALENHQIESLNNLNRQKIQENVKNSEKTETSQNLINIQSIKNSSQLINSTYQRDQSEQKVIQIIKKHQKKSSNSPDKFNSTQHKTVGQPYMSPPKQNNNINLRVFSFVVQKYIQCPALINNRKFDIRVWALLTHNYEVYFFKEGYLRLSSHPYSTNDHKNPFIHLTNNSVQKYCDEYNMQSGNQISLSKYRQYLPSDQIYNRIQCRIRDIIWLSFCSVRKRMTMNSRKDCFEIFGYDFMVDSNYKTWLIQVNTNPAIQQNSPILKQLIPRLIDDAFKLTIDKIFNCSRKKNIQQYEVSGFSNDENMWQLLGDFKQGCNERTMGKRLAFIRR